MAAVQAFIEGRKQQWWNHSHEERPGDSRTAVEAYFAEVDRMRPGNSLTPLAERYSGIIAASNTDALLTAEEAIQKFHFPLAIGDRYAEFWLHPIWLGDTRKLAGIRFVRSDCKLALEKLSEPKKPPKQPQGALISFK